MGYMDVGIGGLTSAKIIAALEISVAAFLPVPFSVACQPSRHKWLHVHLSTGCNLPLFNP